MTLRTDVGDIKIELHCELCPRTCENFLALCASGYYNNNLFHRNMKGFMVQTGDPMGTGKGGTSIWGKKFADEFKEELRVKKFLRAYIPCRQIHMVLKCFFFGLQHTARGVVSMANNGPNTNGSQFFITYSAQPHLDLKYTVFGRYDAFG